MSAIDKIKERMDEIKKLIGNEGRTLLQSEFKAIFDANPELQGLRWKQYTPYFNDGEPCVFGVHDVYIRLADTPEDAGDYEDGYDDAYGSKNPVANSIHEWWGSLTSGGGEEVFQAVFGDHVEVTATREQFDVEGYGHD